MTCQLGEWLEEKVFGPFVYAFLILMMITGSTTIRFRCRVGTDSFVSHGRYSFVMEEFVT